MAAKGRQWERNGMSGYGKLGVDVRDTFFFSALGFLDRVVPLSNGSFGSVSVRERFRPAPELLPRHRDRLPEKWAS